MGNDDPAQYGGRALTPGSDRDEDGPIDWVCLDPRIENVIPRDCGEWEVRPIFYPNQPMILPDGTKLDLNEPPLPGWRSDDYPDTEGRSLTAEDAAYAAAHPIESAAARKVRELTESIERERERARIADPERLVRLEAIDAQ